MVGAKLSFYGEAQCKQCNARSAKTKFSRQGRVGDTKYETFDALNFVSPVDLPQLSADFVGFLVTVRISPALVANLAYLTLEIVNVHSPLRSPSYTPIRLHKSLAS